MSTENQNNTKPCGEEQEIDLLDLMRKIWLGRKRIFKITGCFIFVGLLIALFSAREYTASCEFVPQTSKGSVSSSSMAQLASLAGINMGSMSGGEQLLSPMVYPNILQSIDFQQELLQTQINLQDYPEPVALIDFLTEDEYQRFSIVNFVLKYTIGLPGLIKKAIAGDPDDMIVPSLASDSRIIILTKKEREAIKPLKKVVSIALEEKKGYITITAHMPEAYAAAQVAENTLSLLQKYITEFKIDKVQSNLEFIQERYDELKSEYEAAQMSRARFRDANMNVTSARTRSEMERLDNQYTLAYNVFSEIAAQLEQAKIQVKETIPILTVIDPVSVPIKPSKPQRVMILFGFTFLGLLAGSGYVLLTPLFREAFSGFRREEEN